MNLSLQYGCKFIFQLKFIYFINTCACSNVEYLNVTINEVACVYTNLTVGFKMQKSKYIA